MRNYPHPKIALIGTGLMGAPMAQRLLEAGHTVRVYNRTRAKAEPLAALGAQVTTSPNECVEGADIVITMLTDGNAVGELLFSQGVLENLSPGTVFVDMSSIAPKEAREHSKRLEEASISYVDAPVSGGTKGAQDGTLAIMAGGDKSVIERLKGVFQPMGRVNFVGPVGAGQVAKLANQAIVAITIGAVAEALAFAQAAGADPAAVRSALRGGFAESRILELHGERMLNRDFVPGGESEKQLKDLANIIDTASDATFKAPLSEMMKDRFTTLVRDMDGGRLDHSAILLELEAMNGIKSS